MDAEHIQYLLTHEINFTKNFKISSNLYFNGFKRNWYKLDDVVFEGNSQKISKVISRPEFFSNHFSILNGSLDSENALKVAEWLESQEAIAWVNYPGLKSSKYHEL